MVGFGDDLSVAGAGRLSYWVRLDDAIAEVTRRTEAQVQACARRDLELGQPRRGWPTRTRRCGVRRSSSCPRRRRRRSRPAEPAGRGPPAQHRRGRGRRRDQLAPWRFVVDEKNEAVCRLLGLEVDAHSINPAQFADLVALFEAAESELAGQAPGRAGRAGVRVLHHRSQPAGTGRGRPARAGRGGRPRRHRRRPDPAVDRDRRVPGQPGLRRPPERAGRCDLAARDQRGAARRRRSSTPAAGSAWTRCTPTSPAAGC